MTAEPIFNTVPHDLAVEQAVLGILLFDGKTYRRIEDVLTPSAFYEPLHQRLFGAILSHNRMGRLADPLTIAAQFENDLAFHDLGGTSYLGELVDRAPMTSVIDDYARVLADLTMRRQLIDAGSTLRAAAMRGDETPARVLTQAEAHLHELARGCGTEDHWQDSGELAHLGRMAADGEGKPAYVETGLRAFDNGTGGLVKDRVNIFAGRPGMGKSAVAAWMALSMARMGQAVAMFSLEMDGRELAARLACAAAFDVDSMDNPEYFKANKGLLSPEAKARMRRGAEELRELPIFFDDRAGLTPGQIGPSARRMLRRWEKAGLEPGCIIADHLTIVRPDERTGNMVVDVGSISGAFRDQARQLGITYAVLCQMSRGSEARGNTDKKPDLADLRWSGEIEQDAAQVTFVYRPDYYLREPEGTNYSSPEYLKYADEKARWADRVLLINRKNRGGASGIEIEHGLKLGSNAMWEV